MPETKECDYGLTASEPQKNEAEISGKQNNSKETTPINTTELHTESPTIPTKEIGSINFGYNPNQQKNERLVSQFNTNSKRNDSIEGRLAQNEQIQLLLSEILSEYKDYIQNDKEALKLLIQQENDQAIINNEDQSKMIESMYQYMLINDNELKFENFIISNSIISIKEYLQAHLYNGKISFISKNEIKARLKIDRFINLYRGYRTEHVENSGALTKLENELRQFTNVAKQLKLAIDKGIKEYLGGEGKNDKNKLAQYLNKFLLEAKENVNVKNLINGKDKNSIISVIRYGIKEYARLLNLSDKNPQLKYTGDNVFDMQIRSYLYLYGLIAYPNKFTPENGLNDNELGEILKSILISDGILKENGKDKNKYLNDERKLKEEQIIQDMLRRKESRARINAMQNNEQKSEGLGSKTIENNGSIDVQSASGVEIVQDKQLGSQITGFDRKETSSKTEDLRLQKATLMWTGKMFIKEHQATLSDYLNLKDVSTFFNVGKDGVSFNREVWQNFKKKWISNNPERNPNELNHLLSVLQSLPSKYEENLKRTGVFVDKKKDQAHETVKDYALGAVIDNIKDMLQNIVNTNNTGSFMSGFEFDEKESAKIENNCLLLSGKFNGELMHIKYDLKTGKLYMNSFINESTERITIGGTKPDYEIGELKSFDSILKDFYENSTESMNRDIFLATRSSSMRVNTTSGDKQEPKAPSPQMRNKISGLRDKMKQEHRIKFQKMCGTKLDEIGWKVKNKIESKSTREPVTLNLLRTLGIMPEDENTINLISGSDLYKTVQLITNSNNTSEDLNKFSEYMNTFMFDIGGNWGKNTDKLDKKRENSSIISNKNNKQEYISYVRDNTENFEQECDKARAKAQFEGESNFGILKIIEEKFTSGDYPNWKLDHDKINMFEKNLNHDILAARDTIAADNLINNI